MEALLESLKSFGEPESLGNDPDVLDVLNTYLNQNQFISISKADRIVALLFPDDPDAGILAYIRHVTGNKSAAKGKLQALFAIQWFLKNLNNLKIRRLIWHICDKIKAAVDKLWRSPVESSNVKEEALECIAQILKKFFGQIDAGEFELATMYRDMLVSAEKSQYTPSVRAKMFNCLGIISRYGRKRFLKNEDAYYQLLRLFCNTIKQQVESVHQHLNANILNGCIQGLTEYLNEYKHDLSPTDENVRKLYEKLEQIIDPRCSIANDERTPKLKRREFQRSGLYLIGYHGELYAEDLFHKHVQWFQDIVQWVKSSNAEDSRAGWKAMNKFLEVTCDYVQANPDGEEAQSYVKYFVRQFSDLVSSGESVKSETSIALKGVGLLCSTGCDAKSRKILLATVMNKLRAVVVELNLPGVDKYSGSHFMMPSLLEAIAMVVQHVTPAEWQQVYANDSPKLESLCILLITYFPDLTEKYKTLAPIAFRKVAIALSSNPNTSHYWIPFLHHILRESLTLIIASPTEAEAAILVEAYFREHHHSARISGGKDYRNNGYKSAYNRLGIKTVESYQPFFRNLFETLSPGKTVVQETTFDYILEAVFDFIIEWSIESIEKLDLTMDFVNEDKDDEQNVAQDTSPELETKATVVKDFQLFINLVSFLSDFITTMKYPKLFEKWLEPWLLKMMTLSRKNPLVSGFYRTISFAFDAARKLKYFQKGKDSLLKTCLEFLRDASKQYAELRDEILVSALDVWLSAPSEIILECCDTLPTTLAIVFRCGKVYYPLAERGIYALHRWFSIDNFPDDQKYATMNSLFPLWKSYLSAQEEGTDKASSEQTNNKQSKSYYAQRRLETVGSELRTATLQSVQKGILRLIGSYGHFLDVTESLSETGFITDQRMFLYSIPLNDIKSDIYLDFLIPKLMELCRNSTNRQTRARASEIFHCFTSYVIGYIASRSGNPGNTVNLFRQVLSAVIDFGSDDDPVVRQLFNPLALQIVHWSVEPENTISDLTFRVILDGLVQADSQSKRDFCGTCLEEFIMWSMQNNNTKDISKVILNLISLGQHSAPLYRQAAAVGLNRVYQFAAHNVKLGETYALELLHSFILGLSLCDESDASGLLVQTTKRAVARLERIVIKLKEHLNDKNTARRSIKDVTGKFLVDLIDWILRKSSTFNSVCRQECFRLIQSLAIRIKGISSLQEYLSSYEERNGSLALLNIAEQPLQIFTEWSLTPELLSALEKCTDFYRLISASGQSVRFTVYEETSRITTAMKSILNEFRDNCSTIDHRMLVQCIIVLQNVGNLQGMDEDIIRDVIVQSFKITSFLEELENVKIADMWIRHATLCRESPEVLDFIKNRLKQLMEIDLKQDSATVKTLKWFIYISRDEIFGIDGGMIQTLCLNLWSYVDDKLFRRTVDGLEENTLSMRDKNLVDAAFELLSVTLKDETIILEKLFDPQSVRKGRGSVRAKGEIYQTHSLLHFARVKEIYKFEKLITVFSTESVAALILRLLSIIKTNRSLRKIVGKFIVEKTILVWNQLLLNATKASVSAMISGMASLHKQVCQNSTKLCAWWCGPSLMEDVNLTFAAKTDYVHFFGLFGASTEDTIAQKSVSAMLRYVREDCSEAILKWDEQEKNVLKILYTVITVYSQRPDRTNILEIVLALVSKSVKLTEGKSNSCCYRARKKLMKIVEGVQPAIQLQIAKAIYNALAENAFGARESLAVTNFCLLPCLTSMKGEAVKRFFKELIAGIMHFAGSAQVEAPEWILKITCFSMLEVLCLLKSGPTNSFITTEEFDNVYVAAVGRANPTSDRKNFARDLIKLCNGYANPSEILDSSNRHLVFECNQAAYNASSAALRTINAGFNVFLKMAIQLPPTRENKAGWNNLIDPHVEYSFPDLRAANKDENEATNEQEDVASPQAPQSIFKVGNALQQKSNLMGSSLAIEATDYDFTAAATISNMKYYQKIFGEAKSTRKQDKLYRIQSDSASATIILQHKSMESFRDALLQILNLVEHSESKESELNQLVTVLKALLAHPSNNNIQLFALSAMLNLKEQLKPHSTKLIDSILEAVLPKRESDSIVGSSFNMFLKDILLMLLEWHDVAKPSGNLVYRLLSFLIPLVHNDRKDIFQQNLEFIQIIAKKWISKPENEIPVSAFRNVLEKNEDKKIGLEISKSILLANYFPCNEVFSSGDSRKTFAITDLAKLASDTFSGKSKVAFSIGAEVIGLLLRKLADTGRSDDQRLLMDFVKKQLEKEQSAYPFHVLLIVNSISKFHPSFALLFRDRALSSVRVLETRTEALGLIAKLVVSSIQKLKQETSDDYDKLKEWVTSFYGELANRKLYHSPCKTTEDITFGVEIVAQFLPYIPLEDNVVTLLQWIENAEFCPVPQVRYQFATSTSQLYFNFGGRRDDSVLSRKIEKLFLRLLRDENEDIQYIVNSFWEQNLRKWPDTPGLIITLFDMLGDEKNALEIMTELILRRSIGSTDYSKDVFVTKLRDVVYQKYNIDTSWRITHASLQPLFAESFSSMRNFSQLPSAIQNSVMSQRQGAGGLGLNLLQSTLRNSLLLTPTAPSQYGGTITSQIGDSFSNNQFYSSFNESSFNEAQTGTDTGLVQDITSDPLHNLRRKFTARPAAESGYYAIRTHEQQELKTAREVDAIKAKRGNVKLMRGYTIAELPDISMKHSDFIKTLKALAVVDNELGRIFLAHLVSSVITEFLNTPSDEREKMRKAKKFFKDLNIVTTQVLNRHYRSVDPTFAAAIIDIAVKNPVIITIPSNTVAMICESFELHRLGILALESALQKPEHSSPRSPKRLRLEDGNKNDDVATPLLLLARLYRGLGEYDTLRNVFSMAAKTEPATETVFQVARDALAYESEGKFSEAFEAYSDLYNQEIQLQSPQQRVQMWDASVFKCCQMLSRWNEAFQRANDRAIELGGFHAACTDEYYSGQVLEDQLLASSQILIRKDVTSPRDGNDSDEMEVDDAEEDAEKKEIRNFFLNLKTDQPIWESVLTLVDVPVMSTCLGEEIGRTLPLVDKGISKSLADFVYFDICSVAKKKELLLRLQRVEFLSTYLKLCQDVELGQPNETLKSPTEQAQDFLLGKWKNIGYPLNTSLLSADIIVAERNYYITSFGSLLDRLIPDSEDLLRGLHSVNVEQHMWLLDLSIQAGNGDVTLNTYANVSSMVKETKEYAPRLQILNSKYLLSFPDVADWGRLWGTTWKKIAKVQDPVSSLLGKTNLLRSLLSNLVTRNMDEKTSSIVCKSLSLGNSESLKDIVVNLANSLSEEVSSSLGLTSGVESGNLYFSMYKLLSQIKSASDLQQGSFELNKSIVNAVLCSLACGNSEAVRYFPTVFVILEENESMINDFEKMLKELPTWMVLPWLDQVVANFKHSKKLKKVLKTLIDKVFKDYPAAFQLQYSDLALSSGNQVVTLYQQYAAALAAVTLPEIMFKPAVSYLERSIREGNPHKISDAISSLKRKLLFIKSQPDIFGSIHDDFTKAGLIAITKATNGDNEHGSSRMETADESANYLEIGSAIWKKFDEMAKQKRPDHLNLNDLSPWLTNFQSSDHTELLEIPGLYNKFSRPNVTYHPKIVSFHPTVLVLPSLTKPIRLTIVCNNGKEARYLVKKGDDLRQDKRIQQCFHVCNEIFRSDSRCRDRRLRIVTYSVIPMSEDFGLIQWLDNTESLKRLVLDTALLRQRHVESFKKHTDWILSFKKKHPQTNLRSEYHINASLCSKEDAETFYGGLERMFDEFLLRDHIIRGSDTLEDFYTLRERMIRSYSTLCFVHWLLGIGDRHLENQLISTSSGEFVGIDFGRSFGMAIFKQPVPELVPFRLTPQLLGFLKPYGKEGLFKETMLYIKRCMSKNGEILLTVADIFIKEPSHDWFKNRNHFTQPDEEEIDQQKEDILECVEILQRKLAGQSPINLIQMDVNNSVYGSSVVDTYTKVLEQVGDSSGRPKKLTDEEYVDSLISLASNKYLLSRMFAGWASWI